MKSMFRLMRLPLRVRRRLLFRFVVFPILIGSSLFLIAAVFLQEFTSLDEVIAWLATTAGTTWVIGSVMAYLLENWTGWHTLPRWVKILFPIVLSGIFGVIVQSAIAFNALAYIPDWLKMVLLTGANWLFSQRAYKGIKDSSYGSSARDAAAKETG